MATITWPITLPQTFKRDSYQEEMVKNAISADFEVGPAGLRRRITQNVFTFSGSMFMTTDQWEDMQLFLTEETLDRSLCFGFPDQGGESPDGEWLVFMDKPPSRSWLAEDFWLVTTSFIVLGGITFGEIQSSYRYTDADTIYGTTVSISSGALAAGLYTDADTFYGADVSTISGALRLLIGEAEAFTIDATTDGGTVAVLDIGTPANDLSNVSLDTSNLVQSSADAKVVTWDDGTLHTIAAGNIPQQYDVALTKFGILVEPARTNLTLRSQEFDNASWTKANVTVGNNTGDTTDPFGTSLADKITNTLGGSSGVFVTQSHTVTSATTCSGSVYAKAGSGTTWFGLSGGSGGGNSLAAYFNLATGAVGTTASFGSGWTYVDHYMEAVGNGWYRCTLVSTPPGTAWGFTIRECTSDGANSSTNASEYYLFGAQVEEGAASSSYVATTTVPVTRDADVISAAMSTFPWSDSTGTVYMDYKPLNVMTGTRYAWAAYKDANNHISLAGVTANPIMGNTTGGTPDVATDLNTLVARTRTQITVAYGANDFDGTQDGITATPDSTATLTTGYTQFYLGATGATGSELHGYIYRMAYVPRQVETEDNDIETWRYNF